MSSNLPLQWADKKNSPLLADFIAKHGAEYCMTAEEINQLRDATNEMAEIQKTTFLGVAEPTDTPAGTGRGYWEIITPGTYTNFGGVVLGVDERGLIYRDADGGFSISKAGMQFSSYVKKIDIIGKNKFNKDTCINGFYAEYSSGNLAALQSFFVSDFIKVTPGDNYFLSINGSPSGDQMPFYDIDKNYHSGIISATSFVIPADVYFVRVNGNITNKSSIMLAVGDSPSDYAEYEVNVSIDTDLIISSQTEINKKNNFITVGKKGGCDYQTISEAISASNGTINNPITIMIYGGVYKEALNTVGKFVSLIGINKYDVVVLTQSGNYYYPPLECAGGCYFENIHFKATSEIPDSHTLFAYAVHMDFEGEGITEFFNCIIESHQNSAMGVGLHQNQHLIVNNCELIKKSDGAVVNGGAFYFHNSPFNESGQKLTFKNSTIKTDLGYSVIIDDARFNAGGTDIDTTVSFYNNIFYSEELGGGLGSWYMSNVSQDGGISGRIILTGDSYGNNIPIFNK